MTGSTKQIVEDQDVNITCSPAHPSGQAETAGPFSKLFSRKKRTTTLPASAEVDTRARPFKSSVVEPYIDLTDCTYGFIDSGTKVARALKRFGKEIFADCAYEIVDTDRDACDSDSEDEEEEPIEDKKQQYSTDLTLCCGIHEGTFNGRRVVLLVQNEGNAKGCLYETKVKSSLVLFVKGKRQENFLQEMCEAFLKKLDQKPKEQHFKIYRWSHCRGYWQQTSYEKARLMKSVILPEGMRESIEADMERFLSNKTKNWYNKRGIPYKRSYMFYGVPGTGKTSIITALAGRFQRKVCFLSPHHPKFTDEALKNCLSKVPKKSIVVLEDIDSLFKKDRSTQNGNNPLTFTGLLNGLDGIGEHSGSIFVMTTNFIDRLDNALIRAGRVDMKVEFKRADDFQLATMFKWFYDQTPEEAEKLAPTFVKEVRKKFPGGVTMAELQQHFIDNMFNDAQTAVNNVKHYDLPLMQKLMLAKPSSAEDGKLAKATKGKSSDAEANKSMSKPSMRRSTSH